MPIYEYRCEDCGHELEALQKLSDPKLTTCPECGKESLVKLVSASAFVLKGSGWYVTDFRDKDKPANQGKPANGSAKSDSGESTKSDADSKSTDKSENKKSESSDSSKSESKPAKKAAGE